MHFDEMNYPRPRGYNKVCTNCKKQFISKTKNKRVCSAQCKLERNRWFKHGFAQRKNKTPEYKCWEGMKRRCYLQSSKDFIYYGGRGITVCDRWKDSFENFLADMRTRPSPRHSIDRIDVNGNYEPSNCRWLTQDLQCQRARITSNETGYRGLCKKFVKGKHFGNYEVRCNTKYLGFTKDIKLGAMMYDKEAIRQWGKDAMLNFPELLETYLEELKNEI